MPNPKHEQIKLFIFDDLVEFLEETGEASAITAAEVASLIDASEDDVQACFDEMVEEGVLDAFTDEGTQYVSFTEETKTRLLEEMRESGWVAPEDADADIWDEDD